MIPASPHVRVVLVRPQSGGNVGSAARAMKNMGLSRLAVVSPGPACDLEQARWLAHGAEDVLAAATFVPDLPGALADAVTVIGATARVRRWRSWPVLSPAEVGARAAAAAPHHPVALVFGSEDIGLTNQELDACTHLAHVPTDPAHPSLNLAQAVLILCYETFRATAPARPRRTAAVAGFADLGGVVDQAEEVLERIEWFRGHSRAQARVQVRQTLARAELRASEASFLRGVLRKVAWYLDHGPRADERQAWAKGWRPEGPRAGAEETGEE
ncbi:RNA methyltransferase [Myxococcota bacterium]|nr:RNA methyltransferase [Myxococcota bacterium]